MSKVEIDGHKLGGNLDENISYSVLWNIMCHECPDITKKYNLPHDVKFPFSVDVKLTVNGVELDFVTSLKQFYEDFDKTIKEKASELLESEINELNYSLFQSLRDFRQKMDLSINNY